MTENKTEHMLKTSALMIDRLISKVKEQLRSTTLGGIHATEDYLIDLETAKSCIENTRATVTPSDKAVFEPIKYDTKPEDNLIGEMSHECATIVFNEMTRRASPPAYMDLATEGVRKFFKTNRTIRAALQQPDDGELVKALEHWHELLPVSGCTFNDTNFDSEAVCYGYNTALEEIKSKVAKHKAKVQG